MTLEELADEIARLQEDLPGETEIMIASQPGHPFSYGVEGIAASDEGVIYIAEGRQEGCLTEEAEDAIRKEMLWQDRA